MNDGKRVFSSNPSVPHLLRKTNIFGVYKRVPEPNGRPVPPAILPEDVRYSALVNPYYPDILNDLQLTDHYPIIQPVKLGESETCTLSLNCMKRCKYIQKYSSYNNAFEKEETFEAYSQRLDLLATLIITLIKNEAPVTFSLQEAPDYLMPLGASFYQKIAQETGFAFVEAPISSSQAGLVTLFDPRKLEYNQEIVESSRDCRLQSTTFRNRYTQQDEFRLVNIHGILSNSKMYAQIIADSKLTEHPATIVSGDSNIPASKDAIQALKLSREETAQHYEALNLLQAAGVHGSYAVVQGTLGRSKGGVDTLDIVDTSPSLRTRAHLRPKNLPCLNLSAIERSRSLNMALTQVIRSWLENTTSRLGRAFIDYPAIRSTFPSLEIDSMRERSLRIISLESQQAAQAFSDQISQSCNIPHKIPRPYRGSTERYSIVLSVDDLENMELSLRHLAQSTETSAPPSRIGIFGGYSAGTTLENTFNRYYPEAVIEKINLKNPHLRVVSFKSKEVAQSFSRSIFNLSNIRPKSPQPFGRNGQYSILLNIEQLKKINSDTVSATTSLNFGNRPKR